MKTLLVASLFVMSANALHGQSLSRFNSALPPWADGALTKSGFWATYDLSSRTSPTVEFADLDGDGLADIVAEIVDRNGHRRGLVIVHQLDRSVHIVGAGQDLGASRDRLPDGSSWGMGQLLGHRVGVRVNAWHANGWIVWNGQSYLWVQDAE
jgi:hypothetical protein